MLIFPVELIVISSKTDRSISRFMHILGESVQDYIQQKNIIICLQNCSLQCSREINKD